MRWTLPSAQTRWALEEGSGGTHLLQSFSPPSMGSIHKPGTGMDWEHNQVMWAKPAYVCGWYVCALSAGWFDPHPCVVVRHRGHEAYVWSGAVHGVLVTRIYRRPPGAHGKVHDTQSEPTLMKPRLSV